MAGYPMQGTLIAVEAFVRALENGADPGRTGCTSWCGRATPWWWGTSGSTGRRTTGVGDGRVRAGAGARGQGYATEALRAVVAWALAQPEVAAVRPTPPTPTCRRSG